MYVDYLIQFIVEAGNFIKKYNLDKQGTSTCFYSYLWYNLYYSWAVVLEKSKKCSTRHCKNNLSSMISLLRYIIYLPTSVLLITYCSKNVNEPCIRYGPRPLSIEFFTVYLGTIMQLIWVIAPTSTTNATYPIGKWHRLWDFLLKLLVTNYSRPLQKLCSKSQSINK